MINTKESIYSKAYVELYEMIKYLPIEYKNKIPKYFYENLKKYMDTNYIFTINLNQNLDEQNYMPETKALYINLYEKYLSNEDEQTFWKNYDSICTNMIEKERREKYNPDDIFKKQRQIMPKEEQDSKENTKMIVVQEEKWYKKIFNIIKSLFKKK